MKCVIIPLSILLFFLFVLILCEIFIFKFTFSVSVSTKSASDASNKFSDIKSIFKNSDIMFFKSLEVAALGRFAGLGDLYDARRDQFVNLSLYTTDLSGDAVHSITINSTAINYVRHESLSEKMEKLGVQRALAVSFLLGLVRVSGSANYLKEDKKSSKSATTSLIYSTRTVRDELQIFSKISKSRIDKFLLGDIDATHVVVGIDWGANIVLSFEETNTNSSNFKEIQGKLDSTMRSAVAKLYRSANGNINSFEIENSKSFIFHIYGDIIPNPVPQKINEAIRLIRSIPDLIRRQNHGKGVPMNYVLMPLSTVHKILRTGIDQTNALCDMNLKRIDQLIGVFQEMKDTVLEIKNAYNSLKTWMFMVPERELTKISEMKSKFNMFANNLRLQLADLVLKYRSGDLDEEALVELITSYENSIWTTVSTRSALEAFSPTLQKTKLLSLLQSLNALFIDRRTDKYEILKKNFYRETRIISANLRMNISSPYVNQIVGLLNDESSKKLGAKSYYIEDVEISVPVVHVYLHGRVTRSFSVVKREYVLLTDNEANVMIMDSDSLEKITAYKLDKIRFSIVAVVGDTLYNIDTKAGSIMSTSIENIMPPINGVNWTTQVDSFPPESSYIKNSAAVNQTVIYFVTKSGILYKYDSILKTIAKCGNVNTVGLYASLIMVNDILYIHKYNMFYSFDGITIKEITTAENRRHSGLFQFGNSVCRVGGNTTNVYPDPVACYNPKDKTWTVVSHIREARHYPAVVGTGSKTYIFGGRHYPVTGSVGNLKPVEVFDHDTKIWTYASSTITTTARYCQAVIFHF